MSSSLTEFNFFEESDLDSVSLSKLSEIVEVLFTKRAELDERQKKLDEESALLEKLKGQVISILEKHNQKEFSHAKYGKVHLKTMEQVTMPKDPEKAAKLRAYFYERGMADMLTVNYYSLNSLYSSIKEEKMALGQTDLSEIIPGVDEPKPRVVLSMRKATK